MLEYTGERIIPEKMKITNGMLLEHLARYYFSLYYANGRLLDFACGTGYGSNIIAKAAKDKITEVVAVDIDPLTIQYAKQNYYHPKVTFTLGDVTNSEIVKSLGTFDVIVSFETIEHIEDEVQFLNNVYNLLKPGGTLVISTPFGAGRGMQTKEPFHVHQLTEQEFYSLFSRYSSTEVFYQRSVLIEPKRPGKHYPIGIAVCIK
ncbi:class I SAM-dependent methyltransferase [Mesobacillus harenae]|uniref:class I SAM-dependent methyltransferase n=1 Tax=Mesobacillus harenae TaxID=2213203 RepID=UPI001580020F|nr:class I SAM-dependent methyltransferase [Mesobacillus harenae]